MISTPHLVSAALREVAYPKAAPALALAIGDEQERRHTAKAAQSASGAGAGRPRIKSSPKRETQPTADTSQPSPKARINAIRAAFKAGVKPSVIARQFGVSQQVIRQVLVEG
jgi:DNA-binding transcriptional regulator YiaG